MGIKRFEGEVSGSQPTRRQFLIGLGVTAAGGLVAACSQAPAVSNPAAGATSAAGGAAQAAPTAGGGPVTITWIEWLSPEMGEDNMQRVIAAFEQATPDI
jgi:ABC-type glycerol-3-phosphate transport system substrate-binding protein